MYLRYVTLSGFATQITRIANGQGSHLINTGVHGVDLAVENDSAAIQDSCDVNIFPLGNPLNEGLQVGNKMLEKHIKLGLVIQLFHRIHQAFDVL